MYRHLVAKIYHTVVYTLLPNDYVHESQSATRNDFVCIENRPILYTTSRTSTSVMYIALEKGAWLCTLSRVRKAPPT